MDNTQAMSKKQMFMALLAIAACGMLWLSISRPAGKEQTEKTSAPLPHLTRTYPIMGTMAEVSLYGETKDAEKAADAIYDVFRKIEQVCNIFDPESEISRLNSQAGSSPFVCSELLWDILSESRRAWKISDGAFDITARPLMQLWGFYRKRGESLPSEQELVLAKESVSLELVEFDDSARSVKFKRPGVSFDLGGIAKGYAVDMAADEVAKIGIRRGIINLAGNIRCLPLPPPGKQHYTIGVKNPMDKSRICGTISCLDISMATSGNYERYVTIGGKRYTHIMDVKTGIPVSNMLSVTVLTPSALDADILSTSVFIKGAELAERLCRELPGTQILIIDQPDQATVPRVKSFGPVWNNISL